MSRSEYDANRHLGRGIVPTRYVTGPIPAHLDMACDQGTCNGWIITYNPDDNRVYVCWREAVHGDVETIKTFGNDGGRGLDNARYWAKHNTPPKG